MTRTSRGQSIYREPALGANPALDVLKFTSEQFGGKPRTRWRTTFSREWGKYVESVATVISRADEGRGLLGLRAVEVCGLGCLRFANRIANASNRESRSASRRIPAQLPSSIASYPATLASSIACCLALCRHLSRPGADGQAGSARLRLANQVRARQRCTH